MLSWRFAPLFWCQFFSAFNDNFLKTALVFLILFHIGGADGEALITLAGAIFIAPYFFLSGLGGEMADRYDKSLVAQRLKLSEIVIAGLAIAGFALNSIPVLFVALFGFGTIGALFGPIKYGILPDHLQRTELPAGNALVEGATFIAILTGTISAGMAAKGGGNAVLFSGLVMVFAVLSWLTSLLIPRTGEGAPALKISRNIATSTVALIRHLRTDRRLWWGALVTSWFWLVGIVVLSLLPPLVKTLLGGNEEVVTIYLAMFSIAVGVGSGLAAWLAGGRIIILVTLIGAVLLGMFALELGIVTLGLVPPSQSLDPAAVFASGHAIQIGIGLVGLAIGGGLFIVPTFAAVQAWAGTAYRARVVAAVNVMNALLMTIGALTVALLQKLGVGLSALFLMIAAGNFIVAIVIGRTMPARVFNDFLALIYRVFFRVEVRGLENLASVPPNTILALNHVSFLDAGIALSLLGRDPLFAIDTAMATHWWIKPFLHFTRALPIDPLKPMATRTLIHAVQDGEMLIIFPEGRLTITGSLMKVYDGAAMIADKSDATVVPVRIDGLEYSPFTRLTPRQVRQRWFPKLKVTVLEPVKLNLDPNLRGKKRRQAAGSALYEIMSDLIFRTTPLDRTVPQALIEAAGINGRSRVAIEDPTTGPITYRRLLRAAAILGEKLMPLADVGKPLGVMLPNANGAVITILGVMSAGRVP
ncbi:MAG: MFS transporter, partial [Rhizobiales bacterium]|nr:MFS transporter [Hyphomicrobiales bacterium]